MCPERASEADRRPAGEDEDTDGTEDASSQEADAGQPISSEAEMAIAFVVSDDRRAGPLNHGPCGIWLVTAMSGRGRRHPTSGRYRVVASG